LTAGTRWRIAIVAAFVVATQAGSATWLVEDYETPNASTAVAASLARGEGYVAQAGERLWGPASLRASEPLRFWVLPGEPLLLAAAFTVLPSRLHRYVHVPVTSLLILAVAAFAWSLAGERLALASAVFASVQPFVVLHGPVWDDTFLAAALQWIALAAFAAIIRNQTRAGPPARTRFSGRAASAVAAITLGYATIVRGDLPLFMILLLILTLATPSLRALRRPVLMSVAIAALSLAAWGLRNRIAVGSFETGSSHDGITLWESNGPYTAAALERGQVMMLSMQPELMDPYWLHTREMTEAEANRYFVRRAIEHVSSNGGAAVRLSMRKAFFTVLSLRPELPLLAPRNLVGIVANTVALFFAAIGLVALVRERSEWREQRRYLVLLVPVAVAVSCAVLIGPIGARYKIALDGVVWILSAAGLLALPDAWRRGRTTGVRLPQTTDLGS
jgi:hypothetical protein